MIYDIKKFNKQYGSVSIDECVKEIKALYAEMAKSGEKLVGLLWYLEKTKRFKEYDGYKMLDFKVFVSEICHITYNRYRELAYAYNWYPEESREYGPNTIQAIRSKVSVTKIPKVLGEIKAKTRKIEDPMKRREMINAVIEKYAPPKPKAEKTIEDTKGYWESKYQKLLLEYKALQNENQELRAQLEKQKPAVTAFMKIQDTAANYRQPSA